MRKLIPLLAAIGLIFVLAGCEDDGRRCTQYIPTTVYSGNVPITTQHCVEWEKVGEE